LTRLAQVVSSGKPRLQNSRNIQKARGQFGLPPERNGDDVIASVRGRTGIAPAFFTEHFDMFSQVIGASSDPLAGSVLASVLQS